LKGFFSVAGAPKVLKAQMAVAQSAKRHGTQLYDYTEEAALARYGSTSADMKKSNAGFFGEQEEQTLNFQITVAMEDRGLAPFSMPAAEWHRNVSNGNGGAWGAFSEGGSAF
jgi:hypothetical protein